MTDTIIKYASVTVTDYGHALIFFVEGLGWEIMEDKPRDEGRWLIVAPRGAETGLVIKQPDDPGATDTVGRFTGFAFKTDDLDVVCHRLTSLGFEFPSPPGEMPWGERGAVVADRDGNTYALS